MKQKRTPEIVIISDVHLGTYGCHATELLEYLKSIQPKKLILNGDIIDLWNYSKSYFPKSHIQVIRYILKMAQKGTEVIYLTGNHDDALRQYTELIFGNIQLLDAYQLQYNNKTAWVFHGDIFDHTTKGVAKIFALLGGKGYDWLVLINRCINWVLYRLNRKKVRFSKNIKNRVKSAVKWIGNFEQTIAEIAYRYKYDSVICGHIHEPIIKEIPVNGETILYLNSGDWVENLSSLEFDGKEWSLYFHQTELKPMEEEIPERPVYVSPTTIFQPMNA